MRFEGNSRGINRSDYEQFSQFLGMSLPKYQRDTRGVEAPKRAEVQQYAHPLAMVYGVKQSFCDIYEPDIALVNGTVFEQLNMPFYPVGCKGNGKEGCL